MNSACGSAARVKKPATEPDPMVTFLNVAFVPLSDANAPVLVGPTLTDSAQNSASSLRR